MNERLALAVELARGAGDILRRAYGEPTSIDKKGVIDLVTSADHASEHYLIEGLRRAYPDDAILAEESGAQGSDVRWRWIVDPLDGTVNFAHKLPHFSVLLALTERQDDGSYATRLAVTYDPMRDELFSAIRGAGTTLNGAPVRVSRAERLIDSTLATGFAYERLSTLDDNHAEFFRLNLLCQGVRRLGSAGLDLAYVACGRFDGYWEARLKPWDFTGGVLLVEEAGGVVTRYDGKPLRPDDRALVATNGALHPLLVQALAATRRHPIGSRAGLEDELPPDVAKLLATSEPAT